MADVLAVRNEYRAENWSALIQECNASGLSNREFCRQHGISEKSFYYWLRKLRHQVAEAAETHLIKLDPTPTVEDMLHIRYQFHPSVGFIRQGGKLGKHGIRECQQLRLVRLQMLAHVGQRLHQTGAGAGIVNAHQVDLVKCKVAQACPSGKRVA